MSKKIKIFGFHTNTLHFLFFTLFCSLIAGVIIYNSYFSQKKITLIYELNINASDWKTKSFFKEYSELKNGEFNELYSDIKNKKEFQEINYSDKTIQLVSIKNFKINNSKALNDFELEYDAFIISFLPRYKEKVDLLIKSILKDEYFFLLNFDEISSFEDNSFNINIENSYNPNEFYKNLILMKKSNNFQEYLKLKGINYYIDYKKIIYDEERKISYTDLFILLVTISLIYLSFLVFFKIIRIN